MYLRNPRARPQNKKPSRVTETIRKNEGRGGGKKNKKSSRPPIKTRNGEGLTRKTDFLFVVRAVHQVDP